MQKISKTISTGKLLLTGANARNGIVSVIDQALVSGKTFLTSVIVARACGKEELGFYVLGFSFIIFFTNLQNSFILSPYTVYRSKLNGETHSKYAGSTLVHQLVLTVISMVVIAIAALIFTLSNGPRGLVHVLWVLAVAIFFIMLQEYARRICIARLKMKTAFLLDLFVAIIQIGGILLVLWMKILSPSMAYWVTCIACGSTALVWVIMMRKEFKFHLSAIISDLKLNFSFGKWVFGTRITSMADSLVFPWLLNAYYGSGTTGIYAACAGTVALANPFLFGIGNYLAPLSSQIYSSGGPDKLRRLVLKSFIILIIPMCIFGLIMLLFGERLLTFLYGSKFVGNGLLVLILAISFIVHTLAMGYGYGLWALERSDQEFKANTIGLGITIILGIGFVKRFGALGLASSLLIGNIIAIVIRLFSFNKLIKSM